MFLKRLERRKNGKGHTYWTLVESVRAAKVSRHRLVAYLGELKKSEKGELGIRPIWHQKEDRVLGHILVRFLAYVLWKALAQWMHRSGLGDAPRTLLEEFVKIKNGDVVLPAQLADGSRRTIHLRCVTTPDEAQKVLLNRLGLTIPQRLRRLDEFAPM